MLWKLIIFSLAAIAITTLINTGGRNLIVLLLAVELLFFAASTACLTTFYNNPGAHWSLDLLFASIALTVLAAAESAIALALIARIYKETRSIIVKKKIR